MYHDRPHLAFPRLTPGVRLLLIVNAAVFVVNMVVTGRVVNWLGLSWENVADAYGLGALRLLTHQFVHSFHDPWHIFWNMLMLYFFGTMVEEEIGKRRVLRLYVIAGLVGGIVQLLLMLAMGRDPVAVGASGSVYGIMTWAALAHPRATVFLIVWPIPLGVLVAVLVGIGVYMSYVELVADVQTGVAHGGHVGGALWGFLAWKLARAGADPWRRFDSWRAERSRASAARKRQRLDELLDKVHRQGIGALSGSERRFLQRASQDLRGR